MEISCQLCFPGYGVSYISDREDHTTRGTINPLQHVWHALSDPLLRGTESHWASEVLRHTDLHRSALAAERSIEVDSGVPSTLLRCCLHRFRTSEQNALSVDPTTESFLVNATLAFRQKTGFTRTARDRAMKFALKNCRVYAGEPPAEVKRWRAHMASVLWPHAPKTKAEARRKFLWDYVLNGDVRMQSEVQHFCFGPDCCPNGTESLRAKLRQPYGLPALFTPAPVNFPRRSWQGQHASSAHMLQLFCCHGLLLHMPFDSEVQEYLHRSDSMQNLYVAVRTLVRTDELKRAAVERCGHDYEHKQMCRELAARSEKPGPEHAARPEQAARPEKPGPEHAARPEQAARPENPGPEHAARPEHAVYPAQTAFQALDLHRCLQSTTRDLWQGPLVLSEMFPESKSIALQLLLYRITTRLQGSLYALGIVEQRVYPYAFFEVLKDKAGVADVLEDAGISSELLDSFAKMMLSAFPGASRHLKSVHVCELQNCTQALALPLALSGFMVAKLDCCNCAALPTPIQEFRLLAGLWALGFGAFRA